MYKMGGVFGLFASRSFEIFRVDSGVRGPLERQTLVNNVKTHALLRRRFSKFSINKRVRRRSSCRMSTSST